jgi:hypothetical protein
MQTVDPGELEAERERLEERGRLLAAREAGLADKELRLRRVKSEPTQIVTDGNLTVRVKDLEERERGLALDEARFDADQDIREEKLEKREAAAAALEEKLRRREGDLTTYVAQAQDELERREQEWWGKQLGTPLEAAAS